MKKRILLTYTLTFLFVVLVLSIFSKDIVAFADGLVSGGAVKTAPPVPDGYFGAILIFFALDITAIVFLVKNIIVYVKLKKEKKTFGIVPHAIATMFTLKTIEIFLAVEILLLLVLYLTNRYLSRQIKKLKQ